MDSTLSLSSKPSKSLDACLNKKETTREMHKITTMFLLKKEVMNPVKMKMATKEKSLIAEK
jgi:hypothetical protein